MASSIGQDALRAALPDLTSTLSLAGLDGPVEIVRDGFGIPHINTQTAHDAFFAQGFVHAQDRLWQMEFDRRRAEGTFAEVGGPAAVPMDRFSRRARLVEAAKTDHEHFDAATTAMFAAYTDGVNAFINTTNALPIEFTLTETTPRSWEPWVCSAIFKVRHIHMGLWGQKIWRARILKQHGPDGVAKIGRRGNELGPAIVPPGGEYFEVINKLADQDAGALALSETPEFGGSNNWVVDGSRTASGKPLVAGDPHRFLDVPSVYYQCHMTCPDFDVIGYNFCGVPGFPHFAHNQSVAWAITHAASDYQDLYVERFRKAGDGYEYEFNGEWLPAESRRETLKVRGQDDQPIEIVTTRHGSVVIGDPASGHAMTLRYSSTAEPNPGLSCLLPAMQANNLDELDESMRNWVDPCNNMVMADVHGNIGYLHRGRVPVRNQANAWLPVPGWTGEHDWQGYVPFEELPRSRNPETGWVQTANQRITEENYPHYLSLDYAPPHRGFRLVSRLAELHGATIADMSSIHNDRVSLPSLPFVWRLQQLIPASEQSARALALFDDWQGNMDKHQAAPALYAATRDQLSRLLSERPYLSVLKQNPYRDDPVPMGVEARLFNEVIFMLEEDDTTLLNEGETWQDLLSAAFEGAVEVLTDRLGADMTQWTWGALHTTNPVHPLVGVFPEYASELNPPSVSLGGDGDTVQAAATFPGNSFHINGTSVTRYAFDLGNWDASAWVVPLGVSGHPGSEHYADQAETWSNVELKPMHYSWDKVEAAATTRQTLKPA